MNQDMLEDLKQFVAVTISQQLSLQTDELREEMHVGFNRLDKKLSGQIQELSDSIAEAHERF